MAIPTELVSAAIGAVSGAAVSYWTYRGTLSHQRNRETREQLLEIIELRNHFQELDQADAGYIRMASMLNSKRTIHLANANELAAKGHRSLTPYDCMQLGYECHMDRDMESACAHFERAVRKARKRRTSAITLVVALRYLGSYYLDSGLYHSASKGNQCYLDAVELTRLESPAYLIYATGNSYESWARALAAAGSEDWREVARQARVAYERLPTADVYRAPCLRSIDVLLGLSTETVPRPTLTPPGLDVEKALSAEISTSESRAQTPGK